MRRSRAPSLLHSRKVTKLVENSDVSTAKSVQSKKALTRKVQNFTPPVAKKVTPIVNESIEDTMSVYEVYWTKRSNKKHKTYADGILIIRNRLCTLKDMEGKEIGKTNSYSLSTLKDLHEGNTLEVGAKELEIVKPIPNEDYISGRIFANDVKPVVAAKPTPTRAPPSKISSIRSTKKNAQPQPRHDPTVEGAVVLYAAEGCNDSNGIPHCSVVVDPYIGKKLRPHQIEGVKFLFDCCVGLRNEGWHGCILADAMGLGKTLQAITLLYTLLYQSPHGGSEIRKALIICPSSLVDNWKKELNRWLGVRIKPLCIGGDSNKKEIESTLVSFQQGNMNKVLIISYGYFKRNVKTLQKTAVELILCDEGHKLKNGGSQITKALNSMPTKRRVILSGTPIQNDLQEFYYIMDVVNPGVMGNLAAFKRVYEKPILQSRERNCKPSQREEGDARAKELSRRCNMFILRRNANILIPYLPPKVEQVLFCRLSDVQIRLYSFFLKSRSFMAEIMDSTSYAFGCIQLMSKLCNHPALIYEKCKTSFPEALPLFGEDFDPQQCQAAYSGKVEAVNRILQIVQQDKTNKVVLVSNYTKTLDLLEKLCKDRSYSFLRLDGSTDSSKRMKLVERFNDKHSPEFIFLLSSKAGGVGLNLIGGNRLILLDPDWNPATDEQAMARIWREGQPKPVWIYRMISTGTIEEKIYQRQMRKQALSRSIVDESLGEKRNFTNDELKRLFELNTSTKSETHDLIGCTCLGDSKEILNSTHDTLAGITFSEDDGWMHYDGPSLCLDSALAGIDNQFSSEIYAEGNLISFVFTHKTKEVTDLPVVDQVPESPKEYLGYDEDDFVATKKKTTTNDKTAKANQREPSQEIQRPKRLKKVISAESLLDEDAEMAELLDFSSDE